MEGWFKTHRKLLDSPMWLSEPFTRGQAWIDLIGLASHIDTYFFVRGNKVDVRRGQIAWSEPKLALRWQWSRTKLRAFLNMLEKEQQIIQQKNNVTQVITVVNYKIYQEKEQQTGQQKDSRKTAERQQKDAYKNDKNIKNEKNDKNISYSNEYESKPKNEFLELYISWYEKKTGIQPKISWGRDIKSLNEIEKYLSNTVKSTYTPIEAWGVILENNEKWGKFESTKIQLNQINSNLANIINNIKNGNTNNQRNGNSRITDADRRKVLEDLHTGFNEIINAANPQRQ